MEETYCKFEVHDYKGGELSSHVNLTKDRFLSEMAEQFESCEFEDITDFNHVMQVLTKTLTSEEFNSEYAGGGGFVGEFYRVSNSRMTQVSFEDYLEDIVKYINENWN